MFAAVLSADVAWATAVGNTILNRCVTNGRYVEVEVFECPKKLLRLIERKKVGTVIMSADDLDDLHHAKSISEKGARLVLMTDSNDVAIKAYSLEPEYCTYKAPDEEDYERISSIIFSNCKRE